jgi:geranylgeranyl diphosphate synthase type II
VQDTTFMTSGSRTLSASSLDEHLDAHRRRVEDALAAALPDAEPGRGGCPERLASAMRYSVLGGGKRLRSVLCLMASEACGAAWGEAIAPAVALELIHTYSLIHDDLPAMDDDDLRRGRPTCHKAFDEATAILAGDGLLTLAFELVAKGVRPAASAAECVRLLAEAAGPSGMVGGQMADLQAEERSAEGADGSADELEAIHRRKTGALLRAPLEMGAVVAGASAEEREALAAYGRAVGLAFQIVDDLLDVVGEEAKLGKRVGKDSGHGKWTYPRFLGIEGSRDRARQLAREAVSALAPLGLALLEREF